MSGMLARKFENEFYIDSRLKLDADTTDDFTFVLNRGQNKIRSYRIKDISLPKSWYTIQSGYNSDFQINGATDGTVSISITEGNYTATTLATELQTRIAAALATGVSTVTVDNTNFTFTFANTLQNISLLWSTGVYDSAVRDVLGFANSTTDTTPALSVTSSTVFNLNEPYVYLHSRALAQTNANFIIGPRDVICKIPVGNTISGNLILYQPEVQFYSLDIAKLDRMDFRISRDGTTTADLNGVNWGLTIVIRTE